MRLTTPLLVAALVIAGALIGYAMYGKHQRLQQERAATALIADTTTQLRQALTATPTKEIFSRIDSNLRSLKAPSQPELVDAAEHYIIGAREIVRRRVDGARFAQQAAASRQALSAHMNAAGGRRGEAWFRTALDLKKRVERDHFELDVTLKALQELLGSLPDAEKRLAPHAVLLIEEPLRLQAREQARADAERAAAELGKVRRLAEAR
ncbi:MAG: hypothetical protein E6H47_10610 [Betaproteobacteria bacterium]|nr:MAG: hypothetical protein E6H47_10610 [Betaproteobacteria bacterium]